MKSTARRRGIRRRAPCLAAQPRRCRQTRASRDASAPRSTNLARREPRQVTLHRRRFRRRRSQEGPASWRWPSIARRTGRAARRARDTTARGRAWRAAPPRPPGSAREIGQRTISSRKTRRVAGMSPAGRDRAGVAGGWRPDRQETCRPLCARQAAIPLRYAGWRCQRIAGRGKHAARRSQRSPKPPRKLIQRVGWRCSSRFIASFG